MNRTTGYTLVIVVLGASVAAGLLYEIAWLIGVSMLAVGGAFFAGFWTSSTPVDPDEPLYGTAQAALARPSRFVVPDAPFEGVLGAGAIMVGGMLVGAGLLYDIGWLTGISMLMVGAAFFIGFWRKPKAEI